MNVVFQRDVAVFFQQRGLLGQVFDFRAGRNRAEILDHPFQGLRLVNIAADGQDGVVRAIPAQEKALQVFQVSPVEVFDPADHRPGVGMAVRVGRRHHGFQGAAVGLVVHALAALVLDGFTLDFEFLLRDRVQEHAHAVGFKPQDRFQLVGRNGLVVIGAVRVGGAVQRAAGLLDDLEVLLVADVLRALEHHVLKEVGEAGTARVFAVRADVVGHINMHQRVGAVLVEHHGQTVVQHELLVRDSDFGAITIKFLNQRNPGRQGADIVHRRRFRAGGFGLAGRL